MPVIETNFAARGSRERELYDELVAELKNPTASGQPIIEIRQMNRGGLKHVHVIWDRWKDYPPEARASIIRDVFTDAKGPEFEKSIAITVAATTSEAVEAGLFPCVIQPLDWSQLVTADRDLSRAAMAGLGGAFFESQDVPTLGFAREEEARAAVQQLRHRAPGMEWNMIVTRSGIA